MAETNRHGMNPSRPLPSMGLVTRQKEPKNLETPFGQVDSFLTPTELFYIRSHFPTPSLDVASYQLKIDGAVRNPLSFRYEELRQMPSETRVATLECAGNSRVFLVPQVSGGSVGAWCRRQRRVDRRSPGRFAGPRRPGGRRLRDRARRSRPRHAQRAAHTARPDLLHSQSSSRQSHAT